MFDNWEILIILIWLFYDEYKIVKLEIEIEELKAKALLKDMFHGRS